MGHVFGANVFQINLVYLDKDQTVFVDDALIRQADFCRDVGEKQGPENCKTGKCESPGDGSLFFIKLDEPKINLELNGIDTDIVVKKL